VGVYCFFYKGEVERGEKNNAVDVGAVFMLTQSQEHRKQHIFIFAEYSQ